MIPSIEVRLQSMLHGFRDAVVPAINPGEALAVEQAALIMAQLSALLKQLPYADRYHRLCRDDAQATAAAIVQDAAGGPRSLAAASGLEALLAIDSGNPHADYLALADGIALLTTAAAHDGEAGWRQRIDAPLLAFVCRQNFRERVWCQDAGFDPDPGSLPDLATLCAQTHVQTGQHHENH
jgi:hypothetical protein